MASPWALIPDGGADGGRSQRHASVPATASTNANASGKPSVAAATSALADFPKLLGVASIRTGQAAASAAPLAGRRYRTLAEQRIAGRHESIAGGERCSRSLAIVCSMSGCSHARDPASAAPVGDMAQRNRVRIVRHIGLRPVSISNSTAPRL